MTAKRISRWLVLGFAIAGLTAGPVPLAGASNSVTLDGSFFSVRAKPQVVNAFCPSGVADECGTIELVGLGAADWTYDFGPTFEPDGSCFDVDGTFTLTLQSDGSTISGPLTGLFCPSASSSGQQQGGPRSYGNPFVEDDVVVFANGTGQFSGLTGTASFHTFSAGAAFRGTLQGTLSG
jgi:hypothetical protein